MSVTLQRIDARLYFRGNTYAIKDSIKRIGGHWDADAKAWWIGAAKAAEAEQLVAQAGTATTPAEPAKVSDDSRVVGKAEYKGRSYYILWMGRTSKGDEKARLTVLDGSIDFWANLSEVTITKRYEPRQKFGGYGRGTVEVHQTLGGIRRFIERQKKQEASGVHSACGRRDCRRLEGKFCTDCHDEE